MSTAQSNAQEQAAQADQRATQAEGRASAERDARVQAQNELAALAARLDESQKSAEAASFAHEQTLGETRERMALLEQSVREREKSLNTTRETIATLTERLNRIEASRDETQERATRLERALSARERSRIASDTHLVERIASAVRQADQQAELEPPSENKLPR